MNLELLPSNLEMVPRMERCRVCSVFAQYLQQLGSPAHNHHRHRPRQGEQYSDPTETAVSEQYLETDSGPGRPAQLSDADSNMGKWLIHLLLGSECCCPPWTVL